MFTATRASRVFRLVATLAVVAVVAFGSAAMIASIGSPISSGSAPGAHALSAEAKGTPVPRGTEIPSRLSNEPSQPSAGGNILGVVATISLPNEARPVGVAYDSANGDVYVTDSRSENVSVISGTTQELVASIPLNESPAGVVYDSVNTEIYVGTFFGDVVKVINTTTNTVVANITVLGEPLGLACACSALLDEVYVAQQGLNSVSIISGTTNRVTDTVGVGDYPMSAAFDSANGDVYVANYGSDDVTIIDAADNSVTGSVPVGSEPEGITYDGANDNIYVSNFQSNNVTIVSGTSVITSVNVGSNPVGITYNTAFSFIAVVANGDDAVNFIATVNDTLITSVSVGHLPVGIAYDPVNHYEYVANTNTSNVSVIGSPLPPPWAVTFTESGLPAGTNWSVTLGGVENYSKTSVVNFSVSIPGTYAFSVTPVAGFTESPASGTLSVDGFPVNKIVTFTAVSYSLTFLESGLPNGTLWTVNFDGFPVNSTTSTLLFSVANGTYPYTVGNVSGYSASPASGVVTVAGASKTVPLTFSRNSTPWYSTSISGFPLWVIVAIVAVVVAVIIGVLLIFRRRRPPSPTPAASSGGTSPSSPPATNPPGPQ